MNAASTAVSPLLSSVRPRLLIAASGTGGHVFPALALAEQLSDYDIEWLGVPNRMEGQLVGDCYPLHQIPVEGFQTRPSLQSLKIFARLIRGVFQVRQILKAGQFQGVFTTGGYISGPAIVAARSLGLPVILHESNALPGKVTRWLSPWCTLVALGFEGAAKYLPRAQTQCLGTPVRQAFLEASQLPLPFGIPDDVPLIVVVGGSQGAVAVNRMVRQAAPAWLEAGAWIVHLTGEQDPERESLQHPHYLARPFYDNMAALFRRADLAISRAGAGTLTELAITSTPSILIPYPFAAEDHQTVNAAVFGAADAAWVCQQKDLDVETLQTKVLTLLDSYHQRPEHERLDDAASGLLQHMAQRAKGLAVEESAQILAGEVRSRLQPQSKTCGFEPGTHGQRS